MSPADANFDFTFQQEVSRAYSTDFLAQSISQPQGYPVTQDQRTSNLSEMAPNDPPKDYFEFQSPSNGQRLQISPDTATSSN